MQYIGPEHRHYELKCTVELGMTAQQFFEAAKEEYLRNIIQDVELRGGEVLCGRFEQSGFNTSGWKAVASSFERPANHECFCYAIS